VQLDLILGCLDRVLVRKNGMSMGQMGVMACRLMFIVGQMLAGRAVMRRGLFEVLRREFVMVFLLLHFRLLIMG
jgi:uncharacterized membrane protein YdcZ (DUF606 family)